ncbi:MAG: hypothetical protein HND40_04870 [Ignavibacteriota bacterium]|jgi:hypothetical protein|nr:hypothetical protein [Ignavibacteriota bacterium]MBW7841224.1 hypothetical protein [Ignavibacterium sp.]MCO6448741.1 hypothetical protein [Ignavibacterium album]MCZ2268056.1 hypothetical protein [Ignavibacteriales bacterium]MDX9712620.1 hypothetical protein [Ignavibacteriaceae bacterium]
MPSFENTWLPFIYLYGVGGIFFVCGLVIIKKSKAVNFEKKRHRYWWRITLFGFFYYMAIHALLILAALYL